MELVTREDLAGYALELVIPLMERTAERRLSSYRTEVNDTAGYNLTFAENFCRPLWGIAPVLKESEGPIYLNVRGEKVEVCGWIRGVLSEAAAEKGAYSWRIAEGQEPSSYYNQLKTELAGLMIGILIARQKLWEPYEEQEKQRIASWVYEVNRMAYREVWDCNHIWFIVLNLTVLKALGYSFEETDLMVEKGLERLDRMDAGSGFCQDGQFGRFDYYGPWAMHLYPLLWCMAAEGIYEDCKRRKRAYQRRTEVFLAYYSHMFDSNGCNIPFGRSLSYRFAASALFPAAVLSGCRVSCGLARRILFQNINYFRENAVLTEGILPPGFLYSAPQAVEGYTSDGGAYWCTKAFLALLMPENHAFWTAAEEPMPSERGPFFCETGHPKIHMPISCDRYGALTLYNNTAHYMQNHKKTQWFLDMAGFYSKFAYHSRAGFGISTRDSVSIDNMISLVTPDGAMESHRFGFEDLGGSDGDIKIAPYPIFQRSGYPDHLMDRDSSGGTGCADTPGGAESGVHRQRGRFSRPCGYGLPED